MTTSFGGFGTDSFGVPPYAGQIGGKTKPSEDPVTEVFGSGGYAPIDPGKMRLICVKGNNGQIMDITMSKEFPYAPIDANEAWILSESLGNLLELR
jgi:hypothetical protein